MSKLRSPREVCSMTMGTSALDFRKHGLLLLGGCGVTALP